MNYMNNQLSRLNPFAKSAKSPEQIAREQAKSDAEMTAQNNARLRAMSAAYDKNPSQYSSSDRPKPFLPGDVGGRLRSRRSRRSRRTRRSRR